MSFAQYIRPSGAGIWAICSGYAAMCANYPELPDEPDDEIREDGIACHWLVYEIWNGRYPQLDSLSPNNRILTEEMFDAADQWIDLLLSWGETQNTQCEKQISCDIILAGMKGTPDAFNWNASTRVLRVADLKFGFKFVEVWYNLQLIIYALALIEYLGINGIDDQQTVVEFTIVQPRSYHREGDIRTWRVYASDLRGYANILRDKAHAATQPNAPCTVNPGCHDCRARHACMTFQQAALTAVEISYQGLPLELSPAALGNERRIIKQSIKRLEGRLSGIDAQIQALITSGTVVPYAAIVPHYHRECYLPGVKPAVLNLGKYFNKDVAKPREPVSPAKLRKLLPPDIVAAYAHKPLSGYKVATADPLEAVKKFTKQP